MKSPLKWHNQPGKKKGLLESLSSLLRLFMKHLQALIAAILSDVFMEAMLIYGVDTNKSFQSLIGL